MLWDIKNTSFKSFYFWASQEWSLERAVLSRHTIRFPREVSVFCLFTLSTLSWSIPQEWTSPKPHLLSYPNCFIFPKQGLLEVKHLFCHGVYFLLEALILLKKGKEIIKAERKSKDIRRRKTEWEGGRWILKGEGGGDSQCLTALSNSKQGRQWDKLRVCWVCTGPGFQHQHKKRGRANVWKGPGTN